MTNTKINQIITEEITTAQLPEDLSVEVHFSGNSAKLQAIVRSLFSQSYQSTYAGVTTTKQVAYYTYSQRGFGKKVWGIQGEQRVRERVRKYLAEVNY